MMAGPTDVPLMTRAGAVRNSEAVPAERLDGAVLACDFPYFRFPPDFAAWYERRGAGWINLRRLVAAQLAVADARGARLIDDILRDLSETPESVALTTASGPIGAEALIAAGAFTRDLVGRPLPVGVYAGTILFVRVFPAEAQRLAAMPFLIRES